ncbi:hypothetical protein H6F74_28570 [Trichocoleus sp. FACHB-90]|nr:hypothetical protein [Trichocoleus sp. FACHB-90]
MERLLQGVKKTGRYPHRDFTLLLLIYRHGLRVTEAALLQWKDVLTIDFYFYYTGILLH